MDPAMLGPRDEADEGHEGYEGYQRCGWVETEDCQPGWVKAGWEDPMVKGAWMRKGAVTGGVGGKGKRTREEWDGVGWIEPPGKKSKTRREVTGGKPAG